MAELKLFSNECTEQELVDMENAILNCDDNGICTATVTRCSFGSVQNVYILSVNIEECVISECVEFYFVIEEWDYL